MCLPLIDLKLTRRQAIKVLGGASALVLGGCAAKDAEQAPDDPAPAAEPSDSTGSDAQDQAGAPADAGSAPDQDAQPGPAPRPRPRSSSPR